MMWNRILVATDGTESAQIAEKQAITLAISTHAQLFGIFVTDSTDFDQDLVEQMDQTGQAALQRLQKAAIDKGITVEVSLKFGEPVYEILMVANTIQAELIIVAPHRRNLFYHLLIQQSVTERLVHSAPQSILIVNASDRGVQCK